MARMLAFNKKLPELNKLRQEKKKLEKENPTKEEKEELEKKQKKYKEELEKAKEETIKNIQTQLKKNELNITELDDNKDWKQQILHDPLKFFIVSPLNKTSKLLGLQEANYLWEASLEIILKLLIIEIILVLIYYSETIVIFEFLHHGRLLTIRELKACVAKVWVVSLLVTLFSMFFMRIAGMSSVGNHLVFLLAGFVRFAINTFRVKVFGHREHFPQRGNPTHSLRKP
ncbi:4747_t:CDS:2 [Funneliformis geosporum]|uniref:4747_t:CDS:1 n=1 Tax=Funneliformis geosporum TaxID=1117311 RepID=A0A9W4WV87_9GLOM|nr:4747_t:CDS:2 [Funneliformis geosporum]